MTQERTAEELAVIARKCPVCGSDDIGGELDVDRVDEDEMAWSGECGKCGATWLETYTLTGVEVEVPEPEEGER